MVNLSTFLAASEKNAQHTLQFQSHSGSPLYVKRGTLFHFGWVLRETRHSVRKLCVHKHIVCDGLLCIRIIHQMANILAKFRVNGKQQLVYPAVPPLLLWLHALGRFSIAHCSAFLLYAFQVLEIATLERKAWECYELWRNMLNKKNSWLDVELAKSIIPECRSIAGWSLTKILCVLSIAIFGQSSSNLTKLIASTQTSRWIFHHSRSKY